MAEAGGHRSDSPNHPSVLRPFAFHIASLTSVFATVAFNRAQIADHLQVVGTLRTELALAGVVFAIACLSIGRAGRQKLPATSLIIVGGAVSAVGAALAAWTVSVTIFTIGLVLVSIGSAPAVTLHRLILSGLSDASVRHRSLSWYWAGAAFGAALPLGLQIFFASRHSTLLWLSFAIMCIALAGLLPHALVNDDDTVDQATSALTDVPWVRRARAAAFGAGMIIVAGATPARDLLLGEWQRSERQLAAVLAVAPTAALLIAVFGPWYHRLSNLDGSQRSDAIGLQLFGAGVFVFLGGLSFTYIGLIVCWAGAGALLGLAGIGLDSAVFASIAPSLRRSVAAQQVAAAGLGGVAGIAIRELALSGRSDQWKIAVLGLPLVAVGWNVRRFSDSAKATDRQAIDSSATTVPRRVDGFDGAVVPLLQVSHLDVAYGDVQVLFDVNLTVNEHQVVALLGTNGAGKTTLLRTISGLEPTIGGRVVYAGLNITRTRPTWRVGMGLHQIVGGAAVIGTMTVAENLRLFCHDVDREHREDRIAEALELFPRLAERLSQQAATLSGGEKQMLALAKAIIVTPRLLLIDEFSLGLAPRVIADLLPVVRTIAERGAAVVIVEQSVNIALSVADYAYVMEKGSIGYEGAAADLRARPELLESAYLKGLAQALEA